MPKHRDARRDGKHRPTPPRASSVAGQEAREKKRRWKEKSKHGIHPVIPPRFLIARQGRHHDLKCRKPARSPRVLEQVLAHSIMRDS
jgi:hypothetical protein